MKHINLLIAFAAVFISTTLAMPPMQHRIDGIVQVVDRDKSVVALVPKNDDQPTTFSIQAGRTRFRRDGKLSAPDQLPAGTAVRIYFRQEVGAYVATEISWKSPSSVAPPKDMTGK